MSSSLHLNPYQNGTVKLYAGQILALPSKTFSLQSDIRTPSANLDERIQIKANLIIKSGGAIQSTKTFPIYGLRVVGKLYTGTTSYVTDVQYTMDTAWQTTTSWATLLSSCNPGGNLVNANYRTLVILTNQTLSFPTSAPDAKTGVGYLRQFFALIESASPIIIKNQSELTKIIHNGKEPYALKTGDGKFSWAKITCDVRRPPIGGYANTIQPKNITTKNTNFNGLCSKTQLEYESDMPSWIYPDNEPVSYPRSFVSQLENYIIYRDETFSPTACANEIANLIRLGSNDCYVGFKNIYDCSYDTTIGIIKALKAYKDVNPNSYITILRSLVLRALSNVGSFPLDTNLSYYGIILQTTQGQIKSGGNYVLPSKLYDAYGNEMYDGEPYIAIYIKHSTTKEVLCVKAYQNPLSTTLNDYYTVEITQYTPISLIRFDSDAAQTANIPICYLSELGAVIANRLEP